MRFSAITFLLGQSFFDQFLVLQFESLVITHHGMTDQGCPRHEGQHFFDFLVHDIFSFFFFIVKRSPVTQQVVHGNIVFASGGQGTLFEKTAPLDPPQKLFIKSCFNRPLSSVLCLLSSLLLSF